MPPTVPSFLRRIAALLLLLGCTWAVEIAAFVALGRTQTLAPFAFFPNQSWDFVAKIRWFAGDWMSWAPSLPDRFAGAEAAAKVSALAPLLPATLVTALLVGVVGAVMLSLVSRRRGSLRCDVVAWTVVALLVHVAASIPGFNLEDGLRISRLAFRARSLVVDGMLLASAVSLVAYGAACAVAPLLERSRAAAGASLVLLLAVTGWPPAPSRRPGRPPPSRRPRPTLRGRGATCC